MQFPFSRVLIVSVFTAMVLSAQIPPPLVPPGFGPRPLSPAVQEAKPVPPAPPATPLTAAQATTQAAPLPVTPMGGLQLENASLTAVIDILARQLKLNYILDPGVKGTVVLNTYGDTKNLDTRSLLDLILRINGAAMVQTGDVYRIVPMRDVSRLPMKPQMNSKDIPDNDQVMLNLIFLKYASVDELSKLLEPFIGADAKTWSYPPANLLLILDSSRNMKRTMELVGLFDNDQFTAQRVKLFEVKNGRPSDLTKELENLFKSISLNEKSSPPKFIAIDRINTIIAVAANPGAFDEIGKWIEKLDIAVKVTAGSVDNYVYRVKYANAEALAFSIMGLYTGNMGMGRGGMGGGYGGGMGGGYGGGMGGGYGGGMGGGYGGGMGGGYGGGMGGGGYGGGMQQPLFTNTPIAFNPANPGLPGGPAATADATGSYLGNAQMNQQMARIPRIMPNPMDNSLLIQATAQEYEGITKLLRELDVSPRQVLIDAKIYEVSLSGALASGVAAFLQKQGATGGASAPTKTLVGSFAAAGVNLSAGALVSQSRELLAFVTAQETATKSRVISAPSIIATDSIAASINVGTEVPTLTAQAVTGVQSGGNSLFASSISNRNSGVSLNITARVNPSGIVTLVINQEVSTPIAAAAGGIQSPSFSKRSVQTQVTVQDGDTIAIAGIINETNTFASSGIPVLHKLPIIGAAFGSRSYGKERTELIIFMTPRVIYDTNEITEASEELKSRLKRLIRYVKE